MIRDTPLQREAANPETTPQRLAELIQLPGNRSDCDADAGWCRELVAANPNASAETLRELAGDDDDCMARANAAANPSSPADVIEALGRDRLEWVAKIARSHADYPG